MAEFRYREEKLKEKYKGVNDMVPVNAPQYVYSSRDKEEEFFKNMYPTPELRKEYDDYRNEWYRRAKEFDPGDQPISLNIELVSTCNLACTMCYTITDKFQNSIVGAQRMIPFEIVKKIIDEAKQIGVKCISFSWRGESTMYRSTDKDGNKKDFADVLAYARDKGILERNSLTHGQLIDENMAEKIVLAEPSWISFSIDGMYQTYNKIRTPPNKLKDSTYDAFERVSKSIKLLVKYKKKHGINLPQIRTNSIFPAIQEDPEAYKNYMESIGVDFITVNEIVDYRHHKLEEEMIRENWACQFPFQRLTISANGVIIPCTGCYNEEEGLVLGKYQGSAKKEIKDYNGNTVSLELQDLSLKEAWHSDKLNNIRALHRLGRRKEIEPGCRNCHHGAEKHGADYIPKEWDPKTQQWLNHKHLSEKRFYKLRANNNSIK